MAKETGSVLDIIEIDSIKNDAIVLKNGGLRKILLTSGINFDLKSEEEKEVLIFGYQEFLNSLSFPIQEIIHSRKVNLETYLQRLELIQNKEPSAAFKKIIENYRQFIKEFISQNPIMTKSFFVVVPYDPLPLVPAGRKIAKKFWSAVSRRPREEVKTNKEDLEKNIKRLELQVEELIIGLNQIGVRAIPLNRGEIIELLYNFYNPSAIEKELVKEDE